MMYNGMKTRSRGRSTAKPESPSNDGVDQIHRVEDKSRIAEKELYSEDRLETFAPLNFTVDPSKSKTVFLRVEPRRPALISPAPDETNARNKAKHTVGGPEIPDVEDLPDDHNPRTSSKGAACVDTSDLSPVFPKRAKVDNTQLSCNAIAGAKFEEVPVQASDSDASVHHAAAILVHMRCSAISSQGDAFGNSSIRSVEQSTERATNPRIMAGFTGMRLAQPEDPQELNQLHCFVRSELLEVFSLPGCDDEALPLRRGQRRDKGQRSENRSSGNKSQAGRVGLRCIHCSLLPPNERTGCNMSTFYPKSLSEIYRSVCSWQRIHFQKCRHIPKSVRETYSRLKEQDRTRGKTKYWVTSALRMGLVNINDQRDGIRFGSPPAPPAP